MKEYTHYNRIKATSKRAQNDARISSAERELARPKIKSVLAEKNKTSTWLSELMGRIFFDKRGLSQTRLSTKWSYPVVL